MAREWGFSTKQLHAGQTPDAATGSRAVPIYQTTSYVYDSAEGAADVFAGKRPGYIYSRIDNPTVTVLEKRLAALENGVDAVAFASGMAAIVAVAEALCAPGDEIASAVTLYGGTHTLFASRLPETRGVTTRFFDPDDPASLEEAITPRTRMVYIESIGNPLINIPDFEAIARVAHAHHLPLVCDNTFGTPYLIQLGDHGVDIVVHSLTKYVGGHGTTIGGAVVDMGAFDFHCGLFPRMTTPDATQHGRVYADDAAPIATVMRKKALRDGGACLSPFSAFLFLQGLETLSLRMDRHVENAKKVASYLAAHDKVAWVRYPSLPDDPCHDLAERYFKRGVGAILSFGLEGGLAAGRRFSNRVRLFSILANVADAKSLIIHPATTTHGQMSEDEMRQAGLPPELVRMSVGLEDAPDLIADLAQALAD